jgi:hypothetical protein
LVQHVPFPAATNLQIFPNSRPIADSTAAPNLFCIVLYAVNLRTWRKAAATLMLAYTSSHRLLLPKTSVRLDRPDSQQQMQCGL